MLPGGVLRVGGEGDYHSGYGRDEKDGDDAGLCATALEQWSFRYQVTVPQVSTAQEQWHTDPSGHRIVVVLGHAEYYLRFGFGPACEHGVRCPFPVPDEVFMVQGLVSGALDGVAGVVQYPAAFSEA